MLNLSDVMAKEPKKKRPTTQTCQSWTRIDRSNRIYEVEALIEEITGPEDSFSEIFIVSSKNPDVISAEIQAEVDSFNASATNRERLRKLLRVKIETARPWFGILGISNIKEEEDTHGKGN